MQQVLCTKSTEEVSEMDLRKNIDELGLSTRTRNALRRTLWVKYRDFSIERLVNLWKTDKGAIARGRGIGTKIMSEIEEKLKEHGLI